jgi:hypothetical protein
MRDNRPLRFLGRLLMAAPLVAIMTWLVAGGMSRSFGPVLPPAPPAPSSAPSAVTTLLSGFPRPSGDYPAERLYERVDGAADGLRAAGCRRLLFWTIEDPAAEVELLIFDAEAGAARVLTRDAGPERVSGPGDEASVADQSVYFRRGRLYARIIGDPSAGTDRKRLLQLAERVDRSLRSFDPELPIDKTGGQP